MRSCHELVQEMMKQAKERHSCPGPARPNYHANLLMEDPEGGRGDIDTQWTCLMLYSTFLRWKKKLVDG